MLFHWKLLFFHRLLINRYNENSDERQIKSSGSVFVFGTVEQNDTVIIDYLFLAAVLLFVSCCGYCGLIFWSTNGQQTKAKGV